MAGVDGDLLLHVIPDSPISDEELAEQTRDLKDDLNEVTGVDATELIGPPVEGARNSGNIIIGALALSLFSFPTAMRAKADVKHLYEIIKRFQERHQGKRLQITLSDGTRIDAKNVSEKGLADLLNSVPPTRAVPAEQEKSLD